MLRDLIRQVRLQPAVLRPDDAVRGVGGVGDVDGVVVIPGAALDSVLEAGRARAAKEAGMFEALRAGRTTVELLGLDPSAVEQLGDIDR